MRAALAIALACTVATVAHAQYCPCYSVTAVPNDYNCGVEAAQGTNPTTAQWKPIFELVSTGPAGWGTAGPAVGDIGQGCGKPEPLHDVPAVFPCELLRAIAMQESGWRQFCEPTEPSNKAGPPDRTIIARDCGYGVGQVTSGMHIGESPNFDRDRVAGDATYNLATGTLILAEKWHATNCVGDNQPRVVEDWYVATWAYNGLAYVNNPNNANYDANRPVCDPSQGCAGRPYQERIWGWMEYPPSAEHWTSLAPAYPNRGDIPSSGVPPDLPEPSCAGPTDCANTRSVHVSACLGNTTADGGATDDAGLADGAAGDQAVSSGGDMLPAGPSGSGCGCHVAARNPPSSGGSYLLMGMFGWLVSRGRRRLFVCRSKIRAHG